MKLIATLPLPVAGGSDTDQEDMETYGVKITEVASCNNIVYYVVTGEEENVRECIEECFTEECGYDPEDILAHAVNLN